MDRLAILLMLLAAALWGYAVFRGLEASERLEWAVAGLLLNASAMALWNLELGPAAMWSHWLHYAVAAAISTLALHLGAGLLHDRARELRRFFPPVAFVALTLSVALSAPSAHATGTLQHTTLQTMEARH